MKLSFHTFDLPLRHTFTISRGSIDAQPTLIVELEQDGHRGYGEATSNSFYGVGIEGMIAALESVRPQLEQRRIADPAALWDELHEPLRAHPFAHCALDQAAHDLWDKVEGQPVYRLWGLKTDDLPLTNYTIGLDRIEVMIAKLEERPEWPIFKIKLGGEQDDLEIIRQLRQRTEAVFRVDANCGWTPQQTIDFSHQLAQWNVEFIEQPLAIEQDEQMPRVRQGSALPLIADESCQIPADIQRCHGRFDGVNIKLVKCGGLTPARRMIEQARQLGLKVMVGCMTESTVGISSIAQLLPLLDYVDMDGALLLREDIAEGVTIDNGLCRYPAENGCGVRLTGR